MRCKSGRDQSWPLHAQAQPEAHLPAALPSTPSAWTPPAWRAAGAGARMSPAVLSPAPSSVGCLPQDLGASGVWAKDGSRASWVFLQVGSCTPASPQISWDAIPVFSAAWGPAPPCAQRWTSAYSTVTASLCSSVPPAGLMPGTTNLVVARASVAMVQHPPCQLRGGERHQGSKVWGCSWLASSPSMVWGLEVVAVPSLPT